jgi:YD repeat-containing protein
MMTDRGIKRLALYEYDRNGNKTYEGYKSLDGDTSYQSTSITYDALNRISSIFDHHYQLTYEYDQVGNRRRILADYLDDGTRQEYWYDCRWVY